MIEPVPPERIDTPAAWRSDELRARAWVHTLSPADVSDVEAAAKAFVERGADLGRRAGHPFADLWEFVDWAREHEADLDLTTPPKRLPPPAHAPWQAPAWQQPRHGPW